MNKSKRFLTSKQFEKASKDVNFKNEDYYEITRKVLVDRAQGKAVAEEFDITPQRVNYVVNKVWKAHVKHLKVPEDWVKVEGYLPPDEAEAVQELFEASLSARAKKRS